MHGNKHAKLRLQGTCQAPWKLRMKEESTRLNTTEPRGLSSSMVSRVSNVPRKHQELPAARLRSNCATPQAW